MDQYIKISDFAKLTKSTLKTVMYYHQIGLLREPKRSSSGYRLYGAEELARMRKINHLKSLGLDLRKIKEILGDTHDSIPLRQILRSLHVELLNEKKNIESQIVKVEKLLNQKSVTAESQNLESGSFQIITNILQPDQVQTYQQTCPGLYLHQNNIFSIIDDFNWGEDHQNNFKAIAEYFKDNPNEYTAAIEFGKRLSRLSGMSENDPEIELLAGESAEFIKSIPFLKEKLYGKSGFGEPYENLYNSLTEKVLSPARMKYKKLLQEHLNYRP